MSRIKSKNTSPELRIRSLLHKLGYRFRLHDKKLPGRPDLVLPKYKTVIFVHGCFWHRHRGCKNCTTPTSRRDFWLAKLEGNATRDKLHRKALQKLGWRSIVIWECEVETPKMENSLRKLLTSPETIIHRGRGILRKDRKPKAFSLSAFKKAEIAHEDRFIR